MTRPSPELVERVALILAEADGKMRGNTYALTACRAGVDMAIDYWQGLAKSALEAPPHVELVGALRLAANRLRAAAINEAPNGKREYYEYSEWADEADAALAKMRSGA